MHDQSLSEQPFQEPVGVRHCYVSIVRGTDAVIIPIQAKCAHINCAAEGSQEKNKTEDVFGIPLFGEEEVIFVHAIPWNCDLGDVIEEILDEDLEAGHGFVRQPGAGDQDAEDVAKIGRSDHFDVFDCVSVSESTDSNAIDDDA